MSEKRYEVTFGVEHQNIKLYRAELTRQECIDLGIWDEAIDRGETDHAGFYITPDVSTKFYDFVDQLDPVSETSGMTDGEIEGEVSDNLAPDNEPDVFGVEDEDDDTAPAPGGPLDRTGT